jgi:opacity protein-like surface antigen
MKKSLLFASIALVSVACAFQAVGQAMLPNGLYIKADAGGNLTQDTDLREFFGPVTAGSKVKFDPGARLGVGVGYNLCEWFAVEGEVGAMANNISSITEADRVDAVFSNVPFLVNGRLQLPHGRFCVTPYIGGGVGVSAAIIDAERIELNGDRLHGNASDAVFAYQGFGGLRYSLNPSMGLSVEYRFFGTSNPTWKADFANGTDSDRLKFGSTRTHALSVAFDWTF